MRRVYIVLLIAVVATSCSGCLWPTYIEPVEKLPIIEADTKPKVDIPDVTSLTPRERQLLDAAYSVLRYAQIRDARIEAYNVYATSRNRLFEKQGKELRSK